MGRVLKVVGIACRGEAIDPLQNRTQNELVHFVEQGLGSLLIEAAVKPTDERH
jgi:hypothetical protein